MFVGLLVAATLSTRAVNAAEVYSFDRTYAYPVGGNAKGFSATDCDGDGVIDMVAAAQNSNEVTILHNSGGGQFEFGGGSKNVSQPTGAACADFNGDGLIDFAAASRLGTVDIFRRNPGGDFSLVGSRPAGVGPTSLTSGDLNNDGLPDLVAVASVSEDITVILNTGTDALPPFSRIHVPIQSPHAAAVADFNLDGKVDIAVAGATAPYVVLLFGDGVGFAPRTDSIPSPFTQTKRPPKGQGIASGDLNNDGKPDLALLSSDSVVTLYLGTGAGTFTFLNAFTVGEDAEAIALSDFNDDGLLDLALLSSGTNSAQVLYASAPAVFPVPAVSPQTEAFNASGAATTRSVLLDPADLTSTHTQVLLADSAARALTIAEQTDLASLSVQPLQTLPDAPVSVALADMTGDGIADSVVTSRIGRSRKVTLQVMPGNASGGYDRLTLGSGGTCGNGVIEGAETCDDGNRKARDGCSKTCTVEFSHSPLSLYVADINHDQKDDVVVLEDRGFVFGYLGDGQGRFSQVRVLAKARRKTQLAVADFTGDGNPDVIIVPKSKRDGAITILVNNGLGTFVATPIGFRAAITAPLLAGDFDRNGLPDLLVSYKGGWTLLYNDGAGPTRESGHMPVAKGLKSFAAGDFNEDGWMDVVATFAKAPAMMFHGTVAGTFTGGEPLGLDAKALPPFIVDLDEDRHLDLMSCDAAASASCRVYYGNGHGQFGAAALPSVLSFGREISGAGAGDLDQDGNVDLIGISYRDHVAVVVFRGPQPQRLILPAGQRPTDIAVVDLNNDGLLDFVVASEASRDLSIFVNLGQRKFSQPAGVRLPSVPDHSLGRIALAVGDINGDGTEDLAASQGGGTVTPLLNLGGGGLAALASLPTGARPWGVALGNLNGDDTLDIVTANRDGNSISVQLSGPGGTYTRADYDSGGIRASDVTIADLNGDNFGDVIVTNEKVEANTALGNVVVFLNDGHGVFGPKLVHQRGRETPRSICTGDFDNDGQPDVAIGSLDSNDVMVLHGKGDGTWRSDELDFPVGFGAISVNCIDADGDGRTDIAYARKKAGDVGVVLTGQ